MTPEIYTTSWLTKTAARSIHLGTDGTRILAEGILTLQSTNEGLVKHFSSTAHWGVGFKKPNVRTHPFPAGLALSHIELSPCARGEEQSERDEL